MSRRPWQALLALAVLLWPAPLSAKPPQKPGASSVWGVAFSPDGKQLAVAKHASENLLWDAATGRDIVPVKGHEAGLESWMPTPGSTS